MTYKIRFQYKSITFKKVISPENVSISTSAVATDKEKSDKPIFSRFAAFLYSFLFVSLSIVSSIALLIKPFMLSARLSA